VNYQPNWKQQTPPDAHDGARPARSTPGLGMFGIIAGAMSGAVMGFLAAGAVTIAIAAFVGVVVGLALGWQAHRAAGR